MHAKRKFHEASKINPDNEAAKKGEAYLQKLFAIEAIADEKKLTFIVQNVYY